MSDSGVRVSNDPGSGGAGGAFAELLRLQTEFQARLTEETLGYLRRLQGASAPATPGTVVVPAEGTVVEARGSAGSTLKLSLDVENRQRVHCLVTPMLGPLVSAGGVTWFPEVSDGGGTALVPPGETRTHTLRVVVPVDLPAGTYRGVLVLEGFSDGGVPVASDVPERRAAQAARRRTAQARRTTQSRRPRGT